MSACSLSPRRWPVTDWAASTMRLTESAAYSDGLPARRPRMRSSPAPVSTLRFVKGLKEPSGLRKY